MQYSEDVPAAPDRPETTNRSTSTQKIWLKNYPQGVPAEVDTRAFTSLKDVFQKSCMRFGHLPAYSNMGCALSYAQVDEASRNFAAWLQQSVGLQKGDRVAIMLPNLLQYPVVLFGVLRAGLVVVNVNPQYTVHELEHQLRDSGATAIVVLENFAHTLEGVLHRNRAMKMRIVTTEVGDMFPTPRRVLTNLVVRHVKKMVPPWNIPEATGLLDALIAGQGLQLQDTALGPGDTAFLQYTGGTTGVAKGAMLTHGNLVANLEQLGIWISNDLHEGQEIMVCPLPLYHVFALTCSLVFMKIGSLNVLVTDPRDMHAFVQDLKRHPFTAIIGVNTLYRALLDAPGFALVDTRSLKVSSAGGMAVHQVVAQRWKQKTGVPIIEGYGLTETSPVVMSNPLNIDEWTGTVGMPLPSTDAAILDDQGKAMGIGELGEICVRGPQVMPGYWNRPDETARVFTRDGWLRTGDMGFMDARGYFRITDRKKDMIVVSGFKVFPNQIEDVIALHPGVQEVAAVGVRDERSGEAVKAIVVRNDPTLTAAALLDHCRERLTSYKLPKTFEFRDEPLPKTALGKVLRRALR
jgi:long-chain acyl-CoA synthetase